MRFRLFALAMVAVSAQAARVSPTPIQGPEAYQPAVQPEGDEDEAAPQRAHRRRDENDDSDEPARVRRPGYVGIAFGNPTPSIIGVVAAYQFNSTLQVMVSAGKFVWGDIDATSFAATGRLHLLPFALSPFVGGGATLFMIDGTGDFQGLSYSRILPFLDIGLDLMISGLRISGGLNFHFPVQVVFPFVDVGYAF